MKTRLRHGLSVAAVSIFCILISAFSVFAAEIAGNLDSIGPSEIGGWAVNKDHPDQSAEVVLYVYADGSTTAKELARVNADQYRSDLAKSLGNGSHAFSYQVNWNELQGNNFLVEAYVVSGTEQHRLKDALSYSKVSPVNSGSDIKAASGAIGPAGPASIDMDTPVPETGKKGTYLGVFKTTAYCSCSKCSSGSNLTYSGTVPKANHTISADINLYPIGTKLMIGDIIYTVEDIGSSVSGNRLDIYFETHQQALSYGLKNVDVYAVE